MDEYLKNTARLRLLRPGPERAADGAGFLLANREHLEPFSNFYPESFTVPYWDEVLALGQDEEEHRACVRIWLELLDRPGEVVGMITFSNVVLGAQRGCDLGYSLGGAHEGRGLMTEALQAAIPLVATRLGLHRIKASYLPENVRSGRLLRRLGFEIEGYARDFLWIHGGWRDHVQAALVLPGGRPV